MNVSVVIPCYNHGQYLEEALTSALASTHPHVEVLIVDDGSTEGRTLEVMDQLAARYINTSDCVHLIRQSNKGLAGARNTGIAAATGQYILPLDADDKIRPHFIESALMLMDQESDLGVVFGWAQHFGIRNDIWKLAPFDKQEMLLHNMVPACALFRKQVWLDAGGYDEIHFKEGYEDWDFWLSAMEHQWSFQLIPDVLFDYRVRPGSMVSRCNEPEIRQKLVTRLIDKHRELFSSCWPELLVRRDLITLNHENEVAGYHQRYVESLADFHSFARSWNDRANQLEQELASQREILHQLRHLTAAIRTLNNIAGKLFRRRQS